VSKSTIDDDFQLATVSWDLDSSYFSLWIRVLNKPLGVLEVLAISSPSTVLDGDIKFFFLVEGFVFIAHWGFAWS
jgi:hypothetical protein